MSITIEALPTTPGQSRSFRQPEWLGKIRRATRRQPVSAVAALLFVLIGVAAIIGPALPLPNPSTPALTDRLVGPLTRGQDGTLHIAGTDQLGRDILSRAVAGARISLGLAAVTVIIAGAVGALLGLVAGYRGGVVDQIVMRWVDFQMAFPPLLFAVFLIYLIGASLLNLILLLAILAWTGNARIARAETLRVRAQPYVESAIAAGCSPARVALRHVLPQLWPLLLVVLTMEFGALVLAEASLSYLGLGVQPPDPSWGSMVAEGQDSITTGAWWVFATPGLAIFSTVLLARFATGWIEELLSS